MSALLLAFLLGLPAGAQAPKPTLAVLDFRTGGISAEEMRGILGYLSNALFRTGRYTVIDAARREAALREMEFSAAGCLEEDCQLKIGRLLSASLIAVGEATRLGGRYVVTARLLETETARTVGAAEGRYASLDELVDDLAGLGLRLAGLEGPGEDGKAPEGMVSVPGGSFPMGDAAGDGDADERPVHRVAVSGFLIARNEVTVAEFMLFAAATGYRTAAERSGGHLWADGGWQKRPELSWRSPGVAQAETHPAVQIGWNDAVEYCNWLSARRGLEPCYTISGTLVACDFGKNGFRLPTEAEWEYAARGGPAQAGFRYAGSDTPETVAWYAADAKSRTHPVGEKQPNALGLYDMSGNAFEWVWDRYGPYAADDQKDPTGAASGDSRVVRGGSWMRDARYGRVSERMKASPQAPSYEYGFRLAASAR